MPRGCREAAMRAPAAAHELKRCDTWMQSAGYRVLRLLLGDITERLAFVLEDIIRLTECRTGGREQVDTPYEDEK